MNYSTLSLREVTAALLDVAADAQTTFGGLGAQALNWKPDATRWSVAQCVEHLVTANRLMLDNARDAMKTGTRTVWQRVPLLPRVWGQLLIRSQSPGGRGKYKAPDKAQPATSEIAGDIIQRFVEQHHAAAAWATTLDEASIKRAVMVSPFLHFVTYSVLDGCRLLVAHDRRHFEQAQRVGAMRGEHE
jgi:hypothetical protein